MNYFTWYEVEDGVAVAAIPKNASSSIDHQYVNAKKLTNKKVMDIPVRVAWIRHPHDRLVSCYSCFRSIFEMSGSMPAPKDGSRVKLTEKSLSCWDDFVDHVLRVDGIHWRSQVEILSYKGDMVATDTERFDKIDSKWSDYVENELLYHDMQYAHLEITDHREGDLKKKYSDDYSLYNDIN